MKPIFDKTYIIRGLTKTDDWIGWTDGYSIITGIEIPFIVENNEVIEPVTFEQIRQVMQDEYVPFSEGVEIELVKTPLATGITRDLQIIDYMSLDYFDLWVHFGLQNIFQMRLLPSRRVGVYNLEFNFVGFFAIFRNDNWDEPYNRFLKELKV